MIHPIVNRYHADVGSAELLFAVLHHRFRLLRKHQHVHTFALSREHIAAHLVVSHVCAQHHKGIVARFQFVIQLDIVGCKGEGLACISCKAVYHHLSKAQVVLITPPKRFQHIPSKPFAIEPITGLKALTEEHIERHHHRHTHIIDV